MSTPELKETDYLKTWAMFYISAAVGGAIAGAFSGGILGAILGAAGASVSTIQAAGGVAGFLASLPISYFLFRLFVSRMLVSKLTARTSIESENVA